MTELAAANPERVALVCEEREVTRRELEGRSNRLARVYADRGVAPADFVTISLPNGIEYFAACLATWKLGAVPNPVAPELPASERAAIVERADPTLIVGVGEDEFPTRASIPPDFEPPVELSHAPLPEQVPPNERALASGGSTGLPKLIVATNPAVYDALGAMTLFKGRRAVLIPGPLHHAAPFSAAWQGLLGGCAVVVMRRFDAAHALELIERHRVDRMTVVPTMMQRIWRLPREERLARDLSSLEFVMTGGAPCPAWLMRAWIDWLGPDVMHEAFGPSERIAGTFITGREWLAHPGSVGRPLNGARIKIVNQSGEELPAGEMGEIYMMPAAGPGSTYRYVGAEAQRTTEGWESVGDMGALDEEGYLYLGDRRTDMILCRGHNVYPAEVEAAIDSHPAVRSNAVIGLPEEDGGQRIHAIVESDGSIEAGDLRGHLESLLVHYKVPRSFEFVDEPLRNDAGKVRRSALRAKRVESMAQR